MRVIQSLYVSLLFACLLSVTQQVDVVAPEGVKVQKQDYDTASDDMKAQMDYYVKQEKERERKEKEAYDWKKGNKTLKYEEWKNFDPNIDYQRKLLLKKYDGNETQALWEQVIMRNLTEMTSEKYDYFVVDPVNGTFLGENYTWVLITVGKKGEISQWVADQFNDVYKALKYKKFKFGIIDPRLDELLVESFGRTRLPQIVTIDGEDGMAYFMDQQGKIPNNETLITYFKERQYKNEKYSIKAPKRISKDRRLYIEYAKNWLRKEIGSRFHDQVKNITALHPLIDPIYDHEYSDNLGYKQDRLVVLTLVLFTICIFLPLLYLAFCIWLKIMELVCYCVCCCSHETKVVEVTVEEMEKLHKQNKVSAQELDQVRTQAKKDK